MSSLPENINDDNIEQYIVDLSLNIIIKSEMPLILSLTTLSWHQYRQVFTNSVYCKMTSWNKLIFNLLLLDAVTCRVHNLTFYDLSNNEYVISIILKKIRLEMFTVLLILNTNELTVDQLNMFNGIVKRCQERLKDQSLRNIFNFDDDIKKIQNLHDDITTFVEATKPTNDKKIPKEGKVTKISNFFKTEKKISDAENRQEITTCEPKKIKPEITMSESKHGPTENEETRGKVTRNAFTVLMSNRQK